MLLFVEFLNKIAPLFVLAVPSVRLLAPVKVCETPDITPAEVTEKLLPVR